MEKIEQRPRLSYSMGYKGIVVGGMNQYHPEKMDVSLTMTVDHIEGESKAELKERLEALRGTEKCLIEVVGSTVAEKVIAIKNKFQSTAENLSPN